jgi:hypothetical protein
MVGRQSKRLRERVGANVRATRPKQTSARTSRDEKVARRKPSMVPMSESRIRQFSTISPLTLSDRLITLAKDADTAGYAVTAEQLLRLAITIFDEAPRRPH